MKEQKPRYRRLDLINTMPVGEQKRIGKTLGISKSYVSQILNGKVNQDNARAINVIRLAEKAVERERR